MFTLPKNGPIFTDAVIERSHRLVRSGIWGGIKRDDIDLWMRNFEGEAGKYFGACILDSLIFRSEQQSISLMKDLFEIELPSLALHHPDIAPFTGGLIDYLRAEPTQERPVVIVPVIRRHDPPTKSGPIIARLLKRELGFNQYHMAWPWDISVWRKKYNTSVVLFVDDLLGTGRQIRDFIKSFDLQTVIEEMSCVYCALASHKTGIARINHHFPRLRLATAEQLTQQHDIFDTTHSPFNDGTNTADQAFQYYSTLMAKINGGKTRRNAGFGNLGLVYAFSHGTPNNSLPLLWWSVPGTWTPLLKR